MFEYRCSECGCEFTSDIPLDDDVWCICDDCYSDFLSELSVYDRNFPYYGPSPK